MPFVKEKDPRNDGKSWKCPKCGTPHANEDALKLHLRTPKLCGAFKGQK